MDASWTRRMTRNILHVVVCHAQPMACYPRALNITSLQNHHQRCYGEFQSDLLCNFSTLGTPVSSVIDNTSSSVHVMFGMTYDTPEVVVSNVDHDDLGPWCEFRELGMSIKRS